MRIGVDVGGTNTDAVLMDGQQVVATCKSSTTPDVASGIVAAIGHLLRANALEPAALDAVMVGTTHFTNAFVERRRLSRVGIIRLGFPATTAIPPFTGWPESLCALVRGEYAILPGGMEFDGRALSAFDPLMVREAAARFRDQGLADIAISSVFAPLGKTLESECAAIVRDVIPKARISLSSEFSRLGLLERENAAIMNASLQGLAERTIAAFEDSISSLGVIAPLFISQNDGTLMSAKRTAALPVLTFASGPTNSMRGAAALTGLNDALVIDIGGTTTDIGMLTNGFPRESALTVDIGGVRTNFRMPDLVSIGIGGGTEVRSEGGQITLGPRSVGYEITEKARVFGGEVLTATDIAVAAGSARLGDSSLLTFADRAIALEVLNLIRTNISSALERLKLSADPVPAILVGGGSLLLTGRLEGVSELIEPDHQGVANAVGAAIGQVAGETDEYVSYDKIGRARALQIASESAMANAVAAGARSDTVSLVELEELPIAYMGSGMTRVRARAVGEMDLAGVTK